jgi:hypothetical protein
VVRDLELSVPVHLYFIQTPSPRQEHRRRGGACGHDAGAVAMPSMFLQVQPLDDAASPPLPSSELVLVMATVVSKLIDEDARDSVTKFCALTPPAISVRSYLERIGQYADCSPGCFVLSMVYIDRLGMRLSPLNVHRLLITAVCVASKFLDDSFYPNSFYAQLGGIPLEELNRLEVEFLFSLNFSLHVSPSEYDRYYAGLRLRSAS